MKQTLIRNLTNFQETLYKGFIDSFIIMEVKNKNKLAKILDYLIQSSDSLTIIINFEANNFGHIIENLWWKYWRRKKWRWHIIKLLSIWEFNDSRESKNALTKKCSRIYEGVILSICVTFGECAFNDTVPSKLTRFVNLILVRWA